MLSIGRLMQAYSSVETADEDDKEWNELKERLKTLQHQMTIAQAERDGFQNQLTELKKSFITV